MKRRGIAIGALIALAAPWTAATPASAGYWRHCGNQPKAGAGWYDARAHGVGCGKARQVAQRWTSQAFNGNPSPEPLGFICGEQSLGYELERVACRRAVGDRVQKVRFQVGA